MRKTTRKHGWKKWLIIIISVFFILVLGYGVFAIIASYRMSLGSQHFSGHFIKRHFLKPVHDSN